MAQKRRRKLSQEELEELDKFEYYIFEMDDVLEDFIKEAANEGYVFDYSLESLDRLEEYWLAKKADPDAERIFQRSARYLGEVFRKNLGGYWELCLRSPRYLYYKLPVITGYSDKKIEFCPLAIFNNFVYQEKRGLLRTAIAAHQPWVKKQV